MMKRSDKACFVIRVGVKVMKVKKINGRLELALPPRSPVINQPAMSSAR
ncbi:MAG: hypothetical protein KDJ65_23000 [Anaerolineae bacterium]|nr:hypothetical protein [Anaerolineae bacterium]